jgi:pheromone shutdown protein TraB
LTLKANYANEQGNVTERHKADMGSDSWLSKNIRPMTLIFILVAYFIFAMMSAYGHNANQSYVELLGQWECSSCRFTLVGAHLRKSWT